MKDFSRFLPANLTIPLEQGTYSVSPPTKAVGTQLAALLAVTGSRIRENEPDPKHLATVEALPKDLELGRLSLGEAVFDQMNADGVPGSHIDRLASYAWWYWILGEETADNLADLQFDDAGEDGATDPKDSTAPKPGQSTESGNRTKTASTPATATRPKTSAPKRPSKTKTSAPSPGSGSSKTGG